MYSRALQTPSSARARTWRDFDPAAVRQFKESGAGDFTVGGADLADQAMAAGPGRRMPPVPRPGRWRALPPNVRVRPELLAEHRSPKRCRLRPLRSPRPALPFVDRGVADASTIGATRHLSRLLDSLSQSGSAADQADDHLGRLRFLSSEPSKDFPVVRTHFKPVVSARTKKPVEGLFPHDTAFVVSGVDVAYFSGGLVLGLVWSTHGWASLVLAPLGGGCYTYVTIVRSRVFVLALRQ